MSKLMSHFARSFAVSLIALMLLLIAIFVLRTHVAQARPINSMVAVSPLAETMGAPSPFITATHVGAGQITNLNAASSSPTPLGQPTLFIALSNADNVIYTWNFGDGSPPVNGTTVTHTYASAGDFTASITAMNNTINLTKQVPVKITTAPPPTLTAINSSPTLLGAATNFNATASEGGFSFIWNFGDGSPTANGAQASHTYAQNGNYTATVTAANGTITLTANTRVRITAEAPSTVLNAASTAPTPLGSATFFIATTSGSGFSYVWSFGDGTALGNGATISHTYAITGIFTAIVTATNGTTTLSKSMPVTITTPTEPLLALNDGPTQLGNATNLIAATTSSGYSYVWNFGDGSPTANGANVTHTYASVGNFTATVVATQGATTLTTSTTAIVINTAALTQTLYLPLIMR